jgi:putative peptidoglycan lipid II flippase
MRLPNAFQNLFAEGAFSTAFVPFFAGTMAEHGRAAAQEFAEDVLAVLLTAVLAFVLLGEIFMPAVLAVVAPGFSANPDKFGLAVELARINAPYLLFMALVSLQGGMLNSLGSFAAPAAAPILLNLSLITALLLSWRFGWQGGQALAWAVSAAGFTQFLWLMLSCSRAGMALGLPLPRLTPGVRRALAVMVPSAVGFGVTQLNVLISTILASFLASGSISYLYYADRLNSLPAGVVGTAVATATLPPLSRQLRAGDLAAAVATQNRGLELSLLLTLPAAVALAALAVPILAVLFQHGAFGPADTAATAKAPCAYAVGLPAFVLARVLAPAFFARHDTRTPVKVAVAAILTNLTLSLALIRPLAHVGIALAASAGGWVNALGLFALLVRHGHFRLDRRLRRNLPRIAAAALGMGAILRLLLLAATPALAGTAVLRLAALAGLVAAGLAAFVLSALAPGVADWREVVRRLSRQPA